MDDEILPMPDGSLSIQYMNVGQQCEAGLFDPSFACTETNTERHELNSTLVWLCDTHTYVLTFRPDKDVV